MPGSKWKAETFPSWLDEKRIFPLNPQLRSVTPIILKSIISANGFSSCGFQTEIVESWLTMATML